MEKDWRHEKLTLSRWSGQNVYSARYTDEKRKMYILRKGKGSNASKIIIDPLGGGRRQPPRPGATSLRSIWNDKFSKIYRRSSRSIPLEISNNVCPWYRCQFQRLHRFTWTRLTPTFYFRSNEESLPRLVLQALKRNARSDISCNSTRRRFNRRRSIYSPDISPPDRVASKIFTVKIRNGVTGSPFERGTLAALLCRVNELRDKRDDDKRGRFSTLVRLVRRFYPIVLADRAKMQFPLTSVVG